MEQRTNTANDNNLHQTGSQPKEPYRTLQESAEPIRTNNRLLCRIPSNPKQTPYTKDSLLVTVLCI